MKQPKNYPTLLGKQTENSQVDTTSTSHVVYPKIQWHKLFLTTKVIDTNKQEVKTWQRLYTCMNKIKDKRNEVEAKTTKRTVAE